ncbi:hypothetical protein JOQ06_024480 [Pogonophryne albipinna]|uniref:non-specific serine/threonine protein kinase n=1 Tax=Pogonophryne albipinna TaxID=1090488 RepID=A0AAD6F5K4_9TELE|nr:hypothetical protein JOQ06_024480 [Pogonophryne albipinna]
MDLSLHCRDEKTYPQEIKSPEDKGQRTFSDTEGGKAEPDCGTCDLVCDSENVVTQCHSGSIEERAMVGYESDVSQHSKSRPPAVDACEAGLMSVNDGRRGKAEVSDSTHQTRRSDSPIELWLDACQYLTGETQVSGYNSDGSEGIGWSSDDTRGWGPPVERWSSIDSWASALSDWSGIIAAPPEDFTAAFTEIGAGIDALTQALAEVNTHIRTETFKEGKGLEPGVQATMGIQDQPLEGQNIPESSFLSGQSLLSLCEAARPELRDREDSQSVESLCDSTANSQDEKELEEIQSCQAELSACPTNQHSSMGSSSATMAFPGGYSSDVIVGSNSAYLDLSHFGFEDTFISSEEDPVVLNITEDTDLAGQNKPGELMIEEPFRDEVCEVTYEHIVSQPGSVVEQEVNRSCAEVFREDTEPSSDHRFSPKNTLTNSRVPNVHKQPDTLPDLNGPCQVEQERGSPKFIMPLAPLDICSSLVCRTNCTLEGDQASLNDNTDLGCGHVQPCILWPTLDGITDKTSFDGDELINRKENTTKSAEKSSTKKQPDFVTARKTILEEINDLSNELSHLADVPADHFIVSQRNRIAFITLDLNDPFVPWAVKPIAKAIQSELSQKTAETMPHKTHKWTSESRARSKKDKTAGHHHGVQATKQQDHLPHHVSPQQVCKQQETHPLSEENHISENIQVRPEEKEDKLVIEAVVEAEKAPNKPHGKKKKKHALNATGVKSVAESLVEVDNGAKPRTAKGRIDMFEAKLGGKTWKTENDSDQSEEKKSQKPEAKAKASYGEPLLHREDHKDHKPKNFTSTLNDDIIKKRRLSENKFGKIVSGLESKLPKPDISILAKAEETKADAGATRKKAYSEVVKQKIPAKEDIKVVQPIQAVSVSGDPQTLCLWCQFAAVFSNHTVTWSRGDTVLSESKRSAGDESRVSVNICNASQKDLGKYQCQITSLHGSASLDYVLTYEVLSEIVIPPSPKTILSAPVEVGSEEEDIQCSRLIFKEDFLSDQCFGENQPASIITEKVHFGEGMHRRAFRTTMQAGQIPLLLPGHCCVLKVHNSISYGTKNNDELVQKNFTLAVEECHVQNTAREYIKEYTTAAESVKAFGAVPEIIPIYLVHRPSNDVPYATLEQELIGDFVKYSVKDGKEINLKRRDSEPGQKCCAFQHWVYHKTDGNLLVTDMQGVGMRLTDVGIATCKKGYKGFKGNCATSFIDQFKALHLCNMYCELLGLKSLQPKPRKAPSALKARAPPSAAPKKKTFGPTVKGKSK